MLNIQYNKAKLEIYEVVLEVKNKFIQKDKVNFMVL